MHLRAIIAIARKDALDILQNRSTLGALLSPILLSLLYLLIIRLVGGHATTLLVYNPGQSALQQVMTSAFPTTKVTLASSPDEVTAAFGPNGTSKKATYNLGLIVPADFEQEIQAGAHPQVILYVNGSSISPEQTALLKAAIVNYARAVAAPLPPASLVIATINPARTESTGQALANVYGPITLLVSLIVGLALMPSRLIEEKEKKTLRMILVAPASYADVIVGKLLPVLVYQLALSMIVVAIIQGGLTGNIPLVLLYILLGALFALALGLLIGSIFETTTAASAVSGLALFILILPGIFVGTLGQLVGNGSPVVQISRFVPTYYVAEGALNAQQRQGSFSGNLLDVGVIVGSTVVILLLSVWLVRRQAAVIGTI